jgi:hypothetical protein
MLAIVVSELRQQLREVTESAIGREIGEVRGELNVLRGITKGQVKSKREPA